MNRYTFKHNIDTLHKTNKSENLDDFKKNISEVLKKRKVYIERRN